MSTIGELTQAIKRFVYNNTNAQDLFQGQQAGADLGTLMNKACLTAMNNARLYAERNSSFTWLDTTVSAILPVGLGVNLDRMYWDERAIDVGLGSVEAHAGIIRVSNAGNPLANGDYIEYGTVEGKLAYSQSGTDALPKITWTESGPGAWILGLILDVDAYNSFSAVATPDLATGWLADGQPSPVPTVALATAEADEIRYRYDQRGQVYLAIRQDLDTFWGAYTPTYLQSLTVSKADAEGDITNIPVGNYQIEDYVGTTAIDAETYLIFKLAFRVVSVTAATTWANFYSQKQGFFVQPVRMNTIYAANLLYNGVEVPINLDTRQGQHMRKTIQTNRNTLDYRERTSTIPYCDTDPVLMFDGRKLRPNFELTAAYTINLTGSRWMDVYTVADIDDLEDSTQTDTLITFGFDFMLWQAIIELNNIVQIYVPRAEGSLPPPYKARDEAWGSMLVNDAFAQTSYYHQG